MADNHFQFYLGQNGTIGGLRIRENRLPETSEITLGEVPIRSVRSVQGLWASPIELTVTIFCSNSNRFETQSFVCFYLTDFVQLTVRFSFLVLINQRVLYY